MSNGVVLSEGVVAMPGKTTAEINQQIADALTAANIATQISDLQTQMSNVAPSGLSASAITVTSSPFTYTNSASRSGLVIVSGGTVTTISLIRNSVSFLVGLLAGTFHLAPGDKLAVVYVVAPTMTFVPF
jgi:hypothetical protein